MANRVRERRITYLVAVAAGAGTPTVYAVMGRGSAEALDAVRGLAGMDADATVSVVGSLSTRTAKAIKLGPGEVRAV